MVYNQLHDLKLAHTCLSEWIKNGSKPTDFYFVLEDTRTGVYSILKSISNVTDFNYEIEQIGLLAINIREKK